MVITKKKNTKKLDKLRKSGFNDIRIVEIILSEKMVKTTREKKVKPIIPDAPDFPVQRFFFQVPPAL